MTTRATVLILTLVLFAGSSVYAVDVTTDPVGFVKVQITNTVAGGAYTPIGLPLQRPKADQGLVSTGGVASNTIADTTKNWATNWWDPSARHYVEFQTGAAVGRFFAVETNTVTVLSLAVDTENLQTLGVAAGDRYVIRPFWRLTDVLGPAASSPLKPAANVNVADNVFIMGTNGQFQTIYPRIFGTTTNWYQSSVGYVNNLVLLPDEALLVLRRTGAPTSIVLIGEVKTTNAVTILEQGYNFVANPFPASSVLSNSQLAAVGTGFKPSANVNTADNLYVWDYSLNGGVGGWRTVYHRIFGGSTNWYMSSVGYTNALPLESAAGFLIQNKTIGGYWNRPLPYTP